MGRVPRDSLNRISERDRRRYGLFVQYALLAAEEAVKDASLNTPFPMPVFLGTSRGGIVEVEESIRNGRTSAHLMTATTSNMAASQIAARFSRSSTAITLSNACASGTVAVGLAYRAIKTGQAKVAMAGGTEAPLTRVCIEGYGRMGVLSRGTEPSASRPFDLRRDGFVPSEGACILVLEEMEHALSRGIKPYAEVVAYCHITAGGSAARPSKRTETEVIQKCLKEASLEPEEIGHINTHGTSTVLGDRTEAEALSEVFGEVIREIPLVAAKSLTGHMLAASGPFEIAVTALSLRRQEIPPTPTTSEPEFPLFLPRTSVRHPFQYALSLTFGFGGENAAMILRRLEIP